MVDTKIEKMRFYKKYFTLVIPLIAQQFVYISLNFIDNVMVGRLGEASIAGVGFANKLYFIFVLVIFGSFGGCSIFLSQYYGKKDMKTFRKIFGIMALLSISVGGLFFIFSTVISSLFMDAFSNDLEVINIGSSYLKIIALSFPLSALSLAIMTGLRSMGKTKHPLYIAIIAGSINTILNYMLIYGNWGAPKLFADGAAIATAIARLIEFLLCLYLFFDKKNHLITSFKRYFGLSKDIINNLVKVSVPVFFTETIWVISTTLLYVAYGQVGTIAGASVNIAELVINCGSIIFFGVAMGANILIAQTIGAGKKEEAFAMATKIVKIAIVLSFLTCLIAATLMEPILSFYTLSQEAVEVTRKTLVVFCIMMFFKFINWSVIVGVLRAGGDTTVAFYIDIIPITLIAIPLAFFSAVVLKLDIYWVVLIANLEEVIKLFIALARFKSRKWIKNIT